MNALKRQTKKQPNSITSPKIKSARSLPKKQKNLTKASSRNYHQQQPKKRNQSRTINAPISPSPLTQPITLPLTKHLTKPRSRFFSTTSSSSSQLGTDQKAPIVIESITTSPKTNVFSTLPPAPQKTTEEEQIPDLPNYINSEYTGGRKPIMSMTLDELTESIQQLGLSKFRAKQIFNWVYGSGVTDFSEMRNLSKKDQDVLNQNFFIYPIDLKYVATASDATRKYVFQVEKKGNKLDTIESVFIPRIWNRLYGQDDNAHPDQWDIPLDKHGNPRPDGDGDGDDDDDAASTPYDVSTFLEYQNRYKAYLVKNGKLPTSSLTTGTEFNDLKIIPNSTLNAPSALATSADALINSATSVLNGTTGKNIPLPLHQRRNGHLFVPDFLQESPDNGSSQVHSFDKPLYQYEKGAVCFSSQIGCSLQCSFCHTGTIDKKNVRNLSTGEIISQIMAIKQDLNDFKGRRPHLHGDQNEPGTIVSSVVGMGQGEPFYNTNALLRAISILNAPDGLNMGRRHITISTSGVVTGIDKLAETFPVNLAISLHAVNDELRDKIMPINKIFNLDALMSSIRRYPAVKKTRAVTFEYIMLGGMNDSEADARELLRLIKGIPSLVNLIPFNDWPGCGLESSSANRIRKFQEVINATTFQTGVRCTVRQNRGNSDLAACGTLNSKLSGSLLKHVNANVRKPLSMDGEDVNFAHLVKEATKL